MKKKTVGILTFNRAANYGAVLQAYALKRVCEDKGYEVHIVNYFNGMDDEDPSLIKEFMQDPNKKRACFRMCRSLLGYVWDKNRYKAFRQFRKTYLSESRVCTTADEIVKLGYDYYICGSDQIWNYKITANEFDPIYFGELSPETKCIVYGASAHDTPFPLDMELKFKELLEKSAAPIGIREHKLANYTAELTEVSYPEVIDPTLLAGREVFDELIVDKKNPTEKPYILIYQIDSNPASDISVKSLEERFQCPVYTMTTPRIGSFRGRKGEMGPEEFLTLLKNATFLVTNSFHGIALSLLFEKEFYVYENGGVMSRIDNLLSLVNLHDRKVKMVADIDLQKKIDYSSVKKHLDDLRVDSMSFLGNAFDGERGITVSKTKEIFKLTEMQTRQKQECSGCSACIDICPTKAITMKKDEEGFLYPAVDQLKCIKCGKCDRICGFVPKQKQELGYELPKAFGVKHKDERERETSRSGAAFIAFTDIILDRGGIVYGAAMQEDFSVCHVRATTKKERDCMKTAKYVQSNVTGIYSKVAEDLKNGKEVVFSGTPCQVSGLKIMLESLNMNTDKLVCCDLVCHGVPSPQIWEDYLHYIERKYKKKIREACFRDKQFGWEAHCESFVMEDGNKIVSRDYTDLFYEHIMLRPSCHNCHYANIRRVGDLTLADFWGIEKNDANFNDNRGVSLVLVSSEKGMKLLEQVKHDIEWFETSITKCLQPTLVKPSVASPRRELFWQDYQKLEFAEFLKKYTTPIMIIPRTKRYIKQVLYMLKIRKHP